MHSLHIPFFLTFFIIKITILKKITKTTRFKTYKNTTFFIIIIIIVFSTLPEKNIVFSIGKLQKCE